MLSPDVVSCGSYGSSPPLVPSGCSTFYQIACLRILRGLTQEQLAEKVGTKQPSIARLESGRSTPNLDFLQRVAEALNTQVEIRIVPRSTG